MPSPTVDRASYLARQLLTRMQSLETALLDDSGLSTYRHAVQRQELVAKVLAVETGITDGPTVQLVAAAMPQVSASRDWSDRQQSDLAAFLRAQLASRLD
jgi:hypothetical protein